jgi:chitin disaccharide deacetylase
MQCSLGVGRRRRQAGVLVAAAPKAILAMKIILNADDFGHSPDTVETTIACFESGLLTSATIMVGAPATKQAVQYACAHPEFSFGVHLQFVGDGTQRPLSNPRLVQGLVDEDGRLLPTNVVRRKAFLRRVSPNEIEAETIAQVEYVRSHGVPVTHVDSHRHLHKFPQIRAGLERALPKLKVERVRNVQDVFLSRPLRNPTALCGPAWRRGLMRRFATTEHFYMPTTTSDRGWDEVANRIPSGESIEIGLHPGRVEEWRRNETLGLRAFVERVKSEYELAGWNSIETTGLRAAQPTSG